MLCHVVSQKLTEVSEVLTAFIVRHPDGAISQKTLIFYIVQISRLSNMKSEMSFTKEDLVQMDIFSLELLIE
jgi:hypothetical protein